MLDVDLNDLTSMPSEIGLLTGLQEARFCKLSAYQRVLKLIVSCQHIVF